MLLKRFAQCLPGAPNVKGHTSARTTAPARFSNVHPATLHMRSFVVCQNVDTKADTGVLTSRFGVTVDPAYTQGGAFLKTIGLTNPAEIARILDIAMNPNSLFVDYTGKRSRNSMARSLDVDKDMRPVVDFFITKGVSKGDVCRIISAHPPVLSYGVNDRLEPFWDYLTEIGVQDIPAAVANRPNILGLDVNASLRKIVDYLKSVETPTDQIVKYIVESI